jgi:hypothetical protein
MSPHRGFVSDHSTLDIYRSLGVQCENQKASNFPPFGLLSSGAVMQSDGSTLEFETPFEVTSSRRPAHAMFIIQNDDKS